MTDDCKGGCKMATKQFGKLKLHLSKRGFAFKWGDGEIRRFAFGHSNGGAPQDAYDAAYAQGGEGYADAGRGGYYSPEDTGARYGSDGAYDSNGYPASGDYYDAEEQDYSGVYGFLYRTEWLMWALLIILPPLGIWILWKRERFDIVIRAAPVSYTHLLFRNAAEKTGA